MYLEIVQSTGKSSCTSRSCFSVNLHK